MKIVVDYDRCESNGLCMGILPEVFEVRDDDFMYVLNENPPEEYRAKVLQAINACPTQALSLAEESV
ncbi:MAG TPA: ferredoxin [Acidimicrobiales bacterium]|nr:ferredoxin [Acidimicrobiales bacterium]